MDGCLADGGIVSVRFISPDTASDRLRGGAIAAQRIDNLNRICRTAALLRSDS